MSVNIARATWNGIKWTAAVTAVLVVTGSGLAAAARPATGPADAIDLGPVRNEAPLEANAEAAVLVKAGQVKDVLGFPTGHRRGARHVKDGFNRAAYDEIAETDAAGSVLSIAQFDARGLRLAVRLDKPAQSGWRVSQDGAVKAAGLAARRLGLQVETVAVVESDAVGGGWVVRWARTSSGVRVRGDEIRVGVRADGKIGSLARVEHDLGVPPLEPISSSRALAFAQATLDGWSAQSESGYEIEGATLEWVEPNGIFDPARIDSPVGSFRQAWVVTVKPIGVAAEHIRLLAMYIDASDGTLIGGDTVE